MNLDQLIDRMTELKRLCPEITSASIRAEIILNLHALEIENQRNAIISAGIARIIEETEAAVNHYLKTKP